MKGEHKVYKMKEQTIEHNIEYNAVGGELSPKWKKSIVIIWTGQALSILSTISAGFAAMWYITETTASPLALAFGGIAALLPVGLLSPLGGVFADRYNRKKVMMLSDGIVGLISLALAFVILFSKPTIPLLLAVLAARAMAQAFHAPAMVALMPSLVPERHLVRINSLDQSLTSGAGIFGPVIGIFLYTAIGFEAVLFLDAICAMFACLCLGIAKVSDAKSTEPSENSILGDMLDGISHIKKDTGLIQLLILCAAAMILFMPLGTMFPLVTYDIFSGSGYQASLVEAVWGLGILVGSIILFAWGGGNKLVRIVLIFAFVVGVTIILCGLLQPNHFVFFVILSGIMSLSIGMFTCPIIPIMQKHIPADKMGRVTGLFVTVTTLAPPFGLIFSGFGAEKIGVLNWFLISGIALCVVVLVMSRLKSLNALDNEHADLL